MARKSEACLMLGLLAGAGCVALPPQLSSAHSVNCTTSVWKQGKAAREFDRQTPDHLPEFDEARKPRPLPALSISEIALTKTGCQLPCPSYSVELYADGSVVYVGHSCVERLGERRGHVKPWRFERLARLAEDICFFDLAFAYSSPVADHQATFTMAVRNGESKVVMNYGDAAPPRLWAFEEAIEGVLDDVVWDDE